MQTLISQPIYLSGRSLTLLSRRSFCSPVQWSREGRLVGLCCLILVSMKTIYADQSAVAGVLPAVAPLQVAEFTGSLAQGTDDQAILRKFEVQLVLGANQPFFCVLDDVRTGCPWPESYGRLSAGRGDGATGERLGPEPHLVYSYSGNLYSIPLPFLMLNVPSGSAEAAGWNHAGWKLTVLGRRTVDESECWVIEAKEQRGRRQNLIVDASTGLLKQAQCDVFMGQGDQFRLTLRLNSVKSVEPELVAKIEQISEVLLGLQSDLGRRPDSQVSELSDRQVLAVLEVQSSLQTLSVGTPFQELVTRISNDLQRQSRRMNATANRAGQLKDAQSPEFSLNVLNGGVIDSRGLRGKVVVLHFWDYRDQPLSEPYGQTGYLDFLFNQRRKLGVQVIGVATGADMQTADGLARGKRAARKLAEFMNLTYPITFDDGSLLRALGDPRDSSGQLPLWVVLTPDGKIAHYHAGFYEVDVARGLKELDAVVGEQIKAARAK